MPSGTEEQVAKAEAMIEVVSNALQNIEAWRETFDPSVADAIDAAVNSSSALAIEDGADLSRVVTVDAAIMCLHLMAARIAFRSWAEILRGEIEKVAGYANSALGQVGTWGGLMSRILAFLKAISQVLNVALIVVKLKQADEQARVIREAGHLLREELVRRVLKGERKRVYKSVSSRHYSKPQRRHAGRPRGS